MPEPPAPPQDLEHRQTIDKFAQYVAKNGPAFEEMTRQKQMNNPKFSFLFGGKFTDYYQYRLVCEIQALQQSGFMASLPPVIPPPPLSNAMGQPSVPPQIPPLEEQIFVLKKQISDSESNLKLQNEALTAQKQARVDAIWEEEEYKRIRGLTEQAGLADIEPFEKLVDHLATSGSKDSISSCKKWIFDICNTDRLREIILTYLLYRVQCKSSTDQLRLHILYLINDWAHYCQRKKLDNVKQTLSRYVPKLFAYASGSSTIDNNCSEKLDKLVGVWEGYKYFDDKCYSQLRNPTAIMTAERATILAAQQKIGTEIDKEIAQTMNGYQKQHQEFANHCLIQIATLETQQKLEKEMAEQARARQEVEQTVSRVRHSRFQEEEGPPGSSGTFFNNSVAPPKKVQLLYSQRVPPIETPQAHPDDESLIPKCPYYELPAGMMVPVIGIEECTFNPIDISKLRIPAPEPPSEHLLAEVERFYNLHSTQDNPRDSEGWEVKGLMRYYVLKGEHRAKLEEQLKKEGKTFEDAITNKYLPPDDEKKRNENSPRRSRERRRHSRRSSSDSDTSSSSSSSRSSSRSSTDVSDSPRRQRQRSHSATPEERASFSSINEVTSAADNETPATSISFKIPPLPLNREQNKGAILMAKLGWQGGGLGVNEQGIEEPIHPGEVRDRDNQYQGIGHGSDSSDIYEDYRKQLSMRMSNRKGGRS
ncbi:surp module domain-containing protein [Ditylenchus destructor]|uniref:Surp module domain-containing protein n=1 Tax=Ditylenchus destructor TaxID=166010 RepID=A0AAD4R7H4_9BILA|nr:surp module domain-containing protein [Ditylenchus destructor]